MNNVSRKEFVSSAIWKMVEALSTKGVSMIISIVLARLLLPENYGIVGITDIFVSFSTIFVQSGINTSLIRKEKVDDQDYSNAFFFCMSVAAVLYALFFIFAPNIAAFYKEPLVTVVLRVQMLSLFLCALGTVRSAIIVREFKFKQLCIINLIANIVGGIIGIYIAFKGGGVWALVIYTLTRDGLGALLLFAFVRWKLIFKISVPGLKLLISFSIWVLFATLLDFSGNNIYNMLVGRYYSLADLGYFNKGGQLPQMICLYVFGAITSVLLPAMAQAQSDIPRFKRITKKVTRMSTYMIYPMMAGLAAVADRLIPLLFSEKWTPCIPICFTACVVYAVNPCRSINIQLLYAKGRSRDVLIIEFIRFSMLLVGLIVGVKVIDMGVYGLALIQACIAILNTFITQLFARNSCDYSVFEWLCDQAPAFVMSLIMGTAVYFVGRISIVPDIIGLALQVTAGVAIYAGLSLLSKNPEFYEIRDIAVARLRR